MVLDPAGPAPAVFSAAETLISATKKLVWNAEITLSALEQSIFAVAMIVSTTKIIESRLSIIECGPEMILSGPSITRVRLEMIVSVVGIIIWKTPIIVSALPNNRFQAGNNY